MHDITEPNGGLIARVAGEDVSYYHFEALGSTRLLTDDDGVVTDTYTYDAWGSTTHETGTTAQPYQYVGQLGYYTHVQDNQMDLLQLGVRFYDPGTGRFTQRDWIDDRRSRYVYISNVPTTAVDPHGLFSPIHTPEHPPPWSCETEKALCLRARGAAAWAAHYGCIARCKAQYGEWQPWVRDTRDPLNPIPDPFPQQMVKCVRKGIEAGTGKDPYDECLEGCDKKLKERLDYAARVCEQVYQNCIRHRKKKGWL